MSASLLLQWHTLIFLLPFGIAVLLLLLSSLRVGGHHGRGPVGGHGHVHAHGGIMRGHSVPSGHAIHHGHGVRHGHAAGKTAHAGESSPLAVVFGALGFTRAPLPVVLASFFLVWGFCGVWANQLLLHTSHPTFGQVLPSLGIALVGGLLGGRGAAEMIARILPPDETSVVSRDALFGLTGRIAFPVSETSGRIRIYDEFGTLHDESCRVAPEQPPIEKGQTALVVDRDAQGRLIVEEAESPLRPQ